MEIVKFLKENILIREYKVEKVFGVYIKGFKTTSKSVNEFRQDLWELRKQEIIENHIKKGQGELYPNVERGISLKLLQCKPGKEIWYGQCPYSNKNDMPFEHGCQLWEEEYGNLRYKANVDYSFILIGKNICKKLEECAIFLAKKIGMDPNVKSILEDEEKIAYFIIERVIKDLKNVCPSW